MPKGFTVRLDDDQAGELEAVAKAAGVPVAEEIRQAITARIEERRQDAEFRARLRRSIEERRQDAEFRARLRRSIEDNQKILDRLAR